MALIGSIAIKMTTDAKAFAAGLVHAGKLIVGFHRHAIADFKTGNAMISAGLKDIGRGLAGVGSITGKALDRASIASMRLGSDLMKNLGAAKIFDPVKATARASIDSLVFTFGGAGKAIAGAILKGSAPIVSAARATASSLDYVYGGAFRAIGRGIGAAFRRMPNLAPLGGQLASVGLGAGKAAMGLGLVGMGMAKLGVMGASAIFGRISSAISSTVTALAAAARAAAVFGAAMAAVAGAAIYKTVGAASSLSDALSASRATFGQDSGFIIGEAQKMADAFGVSKRAFVEASTTFGSMFQGAGKSSAEASKLGVALTKTGQDLAAFKGLAQEDTFGRLAAAMRGEFDPAERLGIFLKADDVAARALAMGLAKTKSELSDGAKKMATLALITEQGAKASGYFAQNAGRFSSQTEALWGRMENLSASIGEKLLPIATSLMSEFNIGLTVVSSLWESTGTAAVSSGISTVSSMSQATDSVGWLQKGIGLVANAWQVMGLGAQTILVGLQKFSSALYWGIAQIAKGLEWVGKQMGFAETGAAKFFDEMSKGMSVLADENWQKLGKMANEPWKSEKIDKYFSDARSKTAALQKELMKSPATIAPASTVSGASTAAAKEGGAKFATAMSAGSREATNAILRSRYGNGAGRGAAEQTAKNTAKTNELLGQIVGKMAAAARGQSSDGWFGFAGNF